MLAGGAELGSLLGLDDETAVAALPPDFVVADEEITVGQAAQQFEVTILVLMLGDDVVNKTVPLILCAEENVVGNHGATIGDRVTIYSGASVLGGDTVIGHDAVIGGNAFITHSIAPGMRVSVKNQELEMRMMKDVNW